MTDKLPPLPTKLIESLPWAMRDHVEQWMTDYARQAVREAVPEGKAYTQFLTDVVTAAGLLEHGRQCKPLAKRIAEKAFELNRAYYQIAAAKEAK